MSAPRASVVIPAHDEEGCIEQTLRTLLADAEPGEFQVVVVCNGCADGTADEARQVPGVEVVEIPDASKITALNEGDRRTDHFPRIYLDGDVRLSTHAARALTAELKDDDALAAGVSADYDLSRSSLGVRLFYGFRQELTVFSEGFIGAGVYALSAAGRRRFEAWPDILGDDQFVYRLFAPHERRTVPGHRTRVVAPEDLRTVVRRGVRVRRGNAQLTVGSSDRPALPPPPAGVKHVLRRSVRTPKGFASAVTFLAVTVLIRLIARFGHTGDWRTRA